MAILSCEVGGWRAARIAGCSYRQVDMWVRTGLLQPEKPAQGKGSRRGFSFLDLIRARTIAHARRQGVSLQAIRKVVAALTERYEVVDPLAETARLVIAGDRIYWALNDQDLLDVLQQQMAARPLTLLDVGQIAQEVRASLPADCIAA